MAEPCVPYPGSDARAEEMLRFADAYRAAALELLAPGGGGDASARAPARFCAVHAIELYLDAFLRALGESPCRLRSHGHNLGMRAALAMARGLTLRRKTALHLVRLTADREYLVLRYGPDRVASLCELNRLTASLDEIAHKVHQAAAALTGRPDGEAAA